jgi:hypothetical protein
LHGLTAIGHEISAFGQIPGVGLSADALLGAVGIAATLRTIGATRAIAGLFGVLGGADQPGGANTGLMHRVHNHCAQLGVTTDDPAKLLVAGHRANHERPFHVDINNPTPSNNPAAIIADLLAEIMCSDIGDEDACRLSKVLEFYAGIFDRSVPVDQQDADVAYLRVAARAAARAAIAQATVAADEHAERAATLADLANKLGPCPG